MATTPSRGHDRTPSSALAHPQEPADAVKVDARFAADQYPYEEGKNSSELDTHLVITVEGAETREAAPRPRVGVIAVIDHSGSMGSDRKLATAKDAVRQIAEYLDETDDTLGVVGYSDEANVISAAGKASLAAAKEAVAALEPTWSTNLYGGLELGLKEAGRLADQWGDADAVEIRVILISDGLANVGETRAEKIAELVADLPRGVRVSTIGVGPDCDHSLLADITAAGGGNYGHAEGGAALAGLIGGEFGSIIEVVASDVVVHITERKYAALGGPLGQRYHATQTEDGWRIRIPTVLAGEVRHYVLPAALVAPGRRHARPVTAAEITWETAGEAGGPLRPKVWFAVAGDTDTEDRRASDLVDVIEKAQAAEAVLEAETQARQGNYDGARSVLHNLSETVTSPAIGQYLFATSHMYEDDGAYQRSLTSRISNTVALSGESRLIGAASEFDANWTRSIGASYQTASVRNWAARINSDLTWTAGGSTTDRADARPETTPGGSENGSDSGDTSKEGGDGGES